MKLISFILLSVVHFFIYRIKILYLFTSFFQSLLMSKNLKKKFLRSVEFLKDYNNKKNLNKKKTDYKVVYNSLINISDSNHTLLYTFVLNCFYHLDCKPGFFKSYINKAIFNKIGFNCFFPLESYAKITNKDLDLVIRKMEYDSFQNIINFKYKEIECGKYALSSSMRYLRKAYLDYDDSENKRCIKFFLKKSILFADASINFLDKNKNVKFALFNDRGYCGEGEFFDECINRKIKCIQLIASYKNDIALIKKFSSKNKNDHPSAISDKLWKSYENKILNFKQKNFLEKEIFNLYDKNEWYPSAGTMVGKKMLKTKELEGKIGKIDKSKKTAIIFPHIFWDGTFFYGDDLYLDYEDWYVDTLQQAIKNKNLNWIIKAHPSNIIKDIQDNKKQGEERELTLLKKVTKGNIPDNIFYIPSSFEFSSYYLFELLDFCITVRGTVGIEAAMKDKIVITTGTGRYENKGFTNNIMNKTEYRETLRDLQNFKSLNKNTKEDAYKFAYISLICKNISFSALSLKYEKDYKSNLLTEINKDKMFNNISDKEIKKFINWLRTEDIDYFNDPLNFW
jgi:hypothetical protein|tara:strand:- start:1353 stop:3050 length:1698 start_codon:yes stop_codon:yes gene_type:complete